MLLLLLLHPSVSLTVCVCVSMITTHSAICVQISERSFKSVSSI